MVCMGIEPTTFGLQDQRSADWANKPETGNIEYYLYFIAVSSLIIQTTNIPYSTKGKIIFKIDYNTI